MTDLSLAGNCFNVSKKQYTEVLSGNIPNLSLKLVKKRSQKHFFARDLAILETRLNLEGVVSCSGLLDRYKVIGHSARLLDDTACPSFVLVVWSAQFTGEH